MAESWYAMRTGIGVHPPQASGCSRPVSHHRYSRDRSSGPAFGVLIAVGAGVAFLMALWPLMVAFAEVAAIGLLTVAVLALSVLVVAAFQVAVRRRD